jgi:hypothetical protein
LALFDHVHDLDTRERNRGERKDLSPSINFMSRLIAKNDIFEVQRILMRSKFHKPTFMPGIVDSAHDQVCFVLVPVFYDDYKVILLMHRSIDRITSAGVLRLETILLSEEKKFR